MLWSRGTSATRFVSTKPYMRYDMKCVKLQGSAMVRRLPQQYKYVVYMEKIEVHRCMAILLLPRTPIAQQTLEGRLLPRTPFRKSGRSPMRSAHVVRDK